jgi:predicted ATPase/DNA-binding XRE family transcriptional regulator
VPPSASPFSAEDPDKADFANLLKRFRVAAGLSQQTLADRALVSVQAISALERGYRKAPYRHTIERLVTALGLGAHARAAFEEAASQARERGPVPSHRLASRADNLPRQFTSFFGGETVIAEIADLVTTSALVTIAGTGGAGKTRAAVEVGRQLVPNFAKGVWFVDLAALRGEGLVVNAIAAATGVAESPARPLVDAVVAHFEHSRVLLILDNCEQVVEDVRRTVALLLRRCPGVNVLATSREVLSAAGERVYRIPPLMFPPHRPATAREALPFGAVALFTDRAMNADATFVLTDDNAGDVAEICRRLDGLPLAIELAAARVTVLSPTRLAKRLDRVFSVLTRGDQAVLPRHQTMRAAIDWSYDLLSGQARLFFERLAIFAGGFTLDAAAAICSDDGIREGDVLDLLASLVDKSLVVAELRGDDDRYRLLDSTRQYALERLEERRDGAELARRHARVFLEFAERLDEDWYSAPERRWFAQAQAELDNCRSALKWCLARRNDVATGQRLAGALARVWYSLSIVEGRRWVQAALETVDAATPASVVAQLSIAESELHGALGEYRSSLVSGQAALECVGNPLQAARARHATGAALAGLGRSAEGQALLREALNAARSLRNDRLRAIVLGDFGTARSRSGDIDGARAFYAEALSIYTALGLSRPAASIAGHLAEIEYAAGDAVVALERAQEALAGHTVANNRRSVGNDLCNMAAYAIALDRFEEAHAYATEALELVNEIHATVLTAFALQHVAAVAALRPSDDFNRTRRDCAWAAALLGFVDARLAALPATREFTEQQEYERVAAVLRTALGPEYDEQFARGSDWSEQRAIAEALDI